MAGGATLESNLFESLASKMERELPVILKSTAAAVVLRANSRMAQAKHGRTYKVGDERAYLTEGGSKWTALRSMGARVKTNDKGRRYLVVGAKIHRASAPGEAPAVETGNLTNSAKIRMIGSTTVEVSFNTEYAAVLEFGGAHIAARPFLQPSIDEERPGLEKAIQDLLK